MTPTVRWFNPQELAEINLKRQIEERLKRNHHPSERRPPVPPVILKEFQTRTILRRV